MKIKTLFCVAFVMLATVFVNSCASEIQVDFKSQDAGSCIVSFCPSTAFGRACCTTLSDQCGIDFGNGCTVQAKDGG
jgi:hypothetical protein